MGLNYDEICCRGCHKSHKDDENIWVELQYDFYGIETGYWCNDCYESDKYPYRRDAYYDYLNAGEYLDDNY